MALPLKLPYDQSQTIWKSQLDPVLANKLIQGNLLTGIKLAIGTNAINHLLGRMMVGWMVADINAIANIYRSQPLNDKTLTLTSDAAATVNLWVF